MRLPRQHAQDLGQQHRPVDGQVGEVDDRIADGPALGGRRGGDVERGGRELLVEQEREARVEELGEHVGEGGRLDQVGRLVEETPQGRRRGRGRSRWGGGGVPGLVEDARLAQDKFFEIGGREEERQPPGPHAGGGRGALDEDPDVARQLPEDLRRQRVPGAEVAEHLAHGGFDALRDVNPSPVQEPPAEGQVLAVDVEITTVGLLRVVVIVVLEADARVGAARRERYDAR